MHILTVNMDIWNENMDKNKLFDEKKIDNHTCVHMHIKKDLKIFHFLAKFLNYLKGPLVDSFKILNFELPPACVDWR